MINLIPNEEKKKMAKDFYFRLTASFFMMLSVSLMVTSIALLPAYFFSSTEEGFINARLKLQEEDTISISDQNILMTIQDLKGKLSLIENAKKNQSYFSQRVINEIVLKKMSNIKITEIFYENNQESGKKINISGLAPSREVLLSFRRALEDDPAFSKVDLPISNFVKGFNIRFNLSLSPL